MAINFPDTPAEGDVHVVGTRSWTWDGVAWTSNTSRDYINTVSETEPSNPAPGDTWFKSSTGQTFLYYDSYWIETGVAGPAGPAGADGADGSDASLTRAIRNVSANTTLLADDANQMVRFTGTDYQVLTIPDVLTPGQSVHIVQDNTGQIEFVSGSGVTLLSDNGEFGSNGQNTRVDIVCVADGEYRLYGELVAALVSINIEYLVLAGGGGGGRSGAAGAGGGGGAGGFVSSTLSSIALNEPYSVAIGAGGAGSTTDDQAGISGSSSSVFSSTAVGGGRGGGHPGNSVLPPGDGGSGGGGGSQGSGVAVIGGSGTAGQGNDGGTSSGSNANSAGGGGKGSVGQDATSSAGGDGGAGDTWLDGNVYAAGGGGGSEASNNPGSGGSSIGGNGGGTDSNGTNAVVNKGSGGGGSGGTGDGGNGSSGIVILRYPSDKTVTIGAGLTGSTATVGANKVTTITAGTGNISFS